MNGSEFLQSALDHGATVVTGNARAARRLQLDHGRRQREHGHTAWPTPPICDWQTWLRNLWQEWSFSHPDAPLLLTQLQETALWKTAQGDDANSVVSPESLASLAQQAYALLCDYEAHPARRQIWAEPDAERFRQWTQAFERACSAGNWLSSSRMAERLTAAARDGELAFPPEVHLVGFDRITPAQETFLSALRDRAVPIHFHEPGPARAQLQSGVALSERDEIEACARWLRQALETHPESRLAVLCPSIEQRRTAIDRVFRRILTPEIDSSPDAPAPRAVYEFTLGAPLATVPVIQAAGLALQWLADPLPQSDVSLLLLSGYLAAGDAEHLACARADFVLREQGKLTPLVPLARLLAPGRVFSTLPTVLRRRLQAASDFAAQNRFAFESRLPGAWTELARIALEKFGWPGDRTPGSLQFQAQRRWDRLLEEIALLDLQSRPIRYGDFLTLLSLHAQQALFSPESLDAPIQIMGPMESAGQDFDAAWFLGATDEQWPATGRAHPLLPIGVQREAGMPHARPDDDWDIAQSVTRRILANASHAVFSRAQQNRDGELRPSPIVTALAPEEIALEIVTNLSNPAEFTEPVPESAPVPFSAGTASGGTALLKDQAACPFRAFAAHRLHAGDLPEPEWGLSAMDRGTLLHDVLFRFWSQEQPRRIATRDDLRNAIAENALRSTLEHHIAASFAAKLPQNLPERWLTAYLDAEKRRLADLLTAWLEGEALRQPFTVESRERPQHSVAAGPLHLNLQTDRVDRLADGTRLLIDYKTGSVGTSAWEGDRPDEPQLPLYTVYGNVENLSGVVFAQIRADNSRFLGHVRDARAQLFQDLDDKDPLVMAPFEAAMHDRWQAALSALATEFAQGEARVNPKRGEQTCQYCPLPGLCRIHEINARAEHSLWQATENEEGDDDA